MITKYWLELKTILVAKLRKNCEEGPQQIGKKMAPRREKLGNKSGRFEVVPNGQFRGVCD